MTGDEAKVRVRLDTGQAKAELAGLSKLAASAAGRIGSGITSAVSRGVNAIGLGAGIGAGVAAVTSPTRGGIMDVAGESFGGIGAKLEEFFLGDLGQKARADRAAREETIGAFATVAGIQGRIPPGAKSYFDQVRSLRLQEEQGRTLFEKDSDFRSVSPQDLISRIMEALGKLITDAVDALADKLRWW